MTYKEMIAMPDHEEEIGIDIDESGQEQSSSQGTPTPPSNRPLLPTTPGVHEINVNYHHLHAIEKKNGDQVDAAALLQSFAQFCASKAPGALLQISQNTPQSPSKSKERTLVMDRLAKPLVFSALDIADPPHLKYSDNMDALLSDWENSSYLRIKDVPVPLKYWPQVYRWAKPEAWNVIKDHWSNWRVSSPFESRTLRGCSSHPVFHQFPISF
jgi:hypothetical protein